MTKQKRVTNYHQKLRSMGSTLLMSAVLVLGLITYVSCSNDDDKLDYSRKMQLSSKYIAVGEYLTTSMTKASSAGDVLWEFGDGSSSTDMKATHQYEQEGTYIVTLTVDGDKYQEDIKVEGIGLTKKLKELKSKNEITIMAHRGNTGDMTVPENSLSAIEVCANSGKVDFIEIDLRKTKDGEIVLMHDADIVRTTTGAGAISQYTLKELKTFNLKDRSGNVTQEKVPTFKEALLAARGKVFFDLDLGGRTEISITELYQVLRETGSLDRVLIYTATNAKVAESYLTMDPYIHIYPYYNKKEGLVDYMPHYMNTYGRVFFGQVDSQFVLNNTHAIEMEEKGLLISVNMFDYNTQISNKVFTGVKQVIDASNDNITMMQTDYPYELYDYFKSINKK